MSTFLVVAHQTAQSPELRDALLAKSREDQRAIFTMLVPATPSEDLPGDTKLDPIANARRVLAQAVDALDAQGIKFARCSVGDGDPLTAVREEFERARRTYDGVLLCTLPFGISKWIEQGFVEQIESLFGVPVTHVIASTTAVRERLLRGTDVRVITFSVRLGTPGVEIARRVANELGFRYFDWEVTSEAASRAGVPPEMVVASETAQSLLSRVVERLFVTGVYANDEEMGRLSSTTMSSAITALGSRAYRSFVERVVVELAEHGDAVIVGHAGQVVLNFEPTAFKVLVTGSEDSRAMMLAGQEARSQDEALKLVRESDEERRTFFRQNYGVDLVNVDLYDLTVNTDRISVDDAVRAIVHFASRGRPVSTAFQEEAVRADIRGPVHIHR